MSGLLALLYTFLFVFANGEDVANTTRGLNELFLSSGEESRSHDTAMCVLKLSSSYFVEKKALRGSIVIVNINSQSSTTSKTILETINAGSKYSILVKDSSRPHMNASHFFEKAKNYMMILEDKTELQLNMHQLKVLPSWNPHAKSVIYIRLKTDEDEEALVKELIDEIREYRFLKIIVIVNNIDGTEIKAYTWRPYSDTNCAGPCDKLYLLYTCKKNRVIKYEELRDILPLDMNGCPLTVYTVVSEPYVMSPIEHIQDSQYPDEYMFDLGIEVNLMKMIANITNMTLIFRMSSTPEDWGILENDGTATGLFAKLRQEEVDIIIGNMEVNRKTRKWFDSSNTYMQDDITWCVPKAGTAATWSNLLTIFKLSTWVTTFAAIIVVSLMLHGFSLWENKNQSYFPTNSILMTYGMILGWGALFRPKHTSFRILLLGWLLFSINLNTSYQSFLRSFLIHPKYNKQIQSEADIINAKLGVGGRFTFKENFESGNGTSKFIYENYQNCTSFMDCIKRAGLDKNFAVAGSQRMALYQGQHLGKGDLKIYCYQEGNIIYKFGVAVLARKWFPMLNRFNGIIRSVTENGLIWKWNSEVLLNTGNNYDTNDIIPLGVEHMLGALLFLLIGYGTCFFVFGLEWLCYAVSVLVTKCKHYKSVRVLKLKIKTNTRSPGYPFRI